MEKFFSVSLLICLFLQFLSVGHSWKNLVLLDLGSNMLEGPLPSSLCKLANLNYLLLSDNKLTGEIPECFGNMSTQLTVLDLRKNGFHGKIPTNFPKNNTLRNLGLNGNQLEGTLPKSILNCKSLEVLDVGNNKIKDTFPTWLGQLTELSVLVLKSNLFSGPIGISSNSSFQKLRILDISKNQFDGIVPAGMIDSFQAMKRGPNQTQEGAKYMGDNSYYQDSVTLSIKGLEIEVKRILTIFTTIDLSGNRFKGNIPKEIGELNSLKVLNLSSNGFNGSVPPTIGDLSALESLDLSQNQLGGRIPPQIGKLNFLSVLNVSHNQLVGPIPTGGQFNTFINPTSFTGNPGLCGYPLGDCGRSGEGSDSPSSNDQTDEFRGLTWESVVLGFGTGLIFGLFIGSVMFYTGQPRWFNSIIEDMIFELKRRRRILNRRNLRLV
ncbi:OLC1v1003851C1 [Oldenlandia corymbosa var. corymbosa]|uniref:OLC1v1003851C1 n=1 Tax=Oldenlandia corymbosa var. corymbosa TaxID=529605 RepID=A0AAV1DBK5_OLDCO|nr:OLC1v1003851C1 [Oldenlandia corymbosa var. corymbosa]